MVRIHSPRPTFSITYRQFHLVIRVQTGSTVDPILTRVTDSVGRCRLVLINLPSDDFEELLGAYQEVWLTNLANPVLRSWLHRRFALHISASRCPSKILFAS